MSNVDTQFEVTMREMEQEIESIGLTPYDIAIGGEVISILTSKGITTSDMFALKSILDAAVAPEDRTTVADMLGNTVMKVKSDGMTTDDFVELVDKFLMESAEQGDN